MERIDITLRDGVALFRCRRCGDEVVIDQELPFMPQLRKVAGHACAGEPEAEVDLVARPPLRLLVGGNAQAQIPAQDRGRRGSSSP
jgi:hypothetical protein